jgi:large subunit ribosomal protein L21
MISKTLGNEGPKDAEAKGKTHMFAVLKTGGKQYKVASGDILRIEKVTGNAGETVQFNEILMVGGENLVIGVPTVADAAVQAEILEQGKGPKVINYVKRRRKHSSQRRKGHRQQITILRVTNILAKGAEKSGVSIAENGRGFDTTVAPVKKPAAKKVAAEKKPVAKKVAAEKKPVAKKAAPKKAAAKKAKDK